MTLSIDRGNRVKRQSSITVYLTFVDEFRGANGAWQIVLMGLLIALGIGCVVGVIPQVTTQLYAEQVYDYDGELCITFLTEKPEACVLAAQDAQNAASYASMGRNIISLLGNPMAGSISDVHGRRTVQIFCLFLMALSPAALVMIQVFPDMNPAWYFGIDAITALVSFFSIGFAILSDILPPRHRAASFGMFTGAFFAGLALAPFFATLMDHVQIACFSFVVRLSALILAVLILPETLPPAVAAENQDALGQQQPTNQNVIAATVLRPLREMQILLRNKTLILVTCGIFMAKMVFSADVTLFFYYVENELGVRDKDVAGMLFVTGIVGVLMQAVFLKYLISLLGERLLLLSSYVSGILHNLVYGLARDKAMLYVGLCLSQFTGTNGPLLSSLVSRNVDATEQGRVQGALFALSALAEATGPVLMNYVYRRCHVLGRGTMFVVAAILYAVGTIAISLLPPKKDGASHEDKSNNGTEIVNHDEETALLQ